MPMNKNCIVIYQRGIKAECGSRKMSIKIWAELAYHSMVLYGDLLEKENSIVLEPKPPFKTIKSNSIHGTKNYYLKTMCFMVSAVPWTLSTDWLTHWDVGTIPPALKNMNNG